MELNTVPNLVPIDVRPPIINRATRAAIKAVFESRHAFFVLAKDIHNFTHLKPLIKIHVVHAGQTYPADPPTLQSGGLAVPTFSKTIAPTC